ncbi:uncharacterized protein LOC108680919 [Hyalella azteca]|uniref:Uncharacterized protein LOC108680919 n=1 Tax=Hyalella azteca TaxID=294128 RepID=A0A8B7PGR9_HYAAZ|nr:uncharacterized protein LOC108680919 [Hyalella azteca]
MAKNNIFPQHGLTSRQLCDKCRNHIKFSKKRGHKGKCQFENCKCAYCHLTDMRRLIMKHQQRVRRANVTAKVLSFAKFSIADFTFRVRLISSEIDDDEDSKSESHEGAHQNDGAEALERDINDEGNSEEAIVGAIKAATLTIEALSKHFGLISSTGVVPRTNKSSAVNRPPLKRKGTPPSGILQADALSTLVQFRATQTLPPTVMTNYNVQLYPDLVPNSWEKPDSRLSPPGSSLSPPDSRMSPLDSRMSPPDCRMSPPVSVASYSIANYSPQTPTPSHATAAIYEATAPIKQEIKDEDGWPNTPAAEPSFIHPHFSPALPPHKGAPMLLPPSHSTYLNRMPPFYPLVSQANEAGAAPQMFSPFRGNMPPMFSSACSFLFKKSPQSDYSSMSKALDSCKNRSIRDMREGCHNYENDSGVADRDEFMYEKLFSRGVIGHSAERITVRDSISVTQTAPSNAPEGFDYFAKMELQRDIDYRDID